MNNPRDKSWYGEFVDSYICDDPWSKRYFWKTQSDLNSDYVPAQHLRDLLKAFQRKTIFEELEESFEVSDKDIDLLLGGDETNG